MENENQAPVVPVKINSDTLFDDMGKNMQLGFGKLPEPLGAPEPKKEKEEVKITTEQQLDDKLRVTVTSPATPVTPPTPTPEEPEWANINPLKTTTPESREPDYKAEYEKLNQVKTQLENQIKSTPEWVKKLAEIATDPAFDYDKWIRSQAKEDFSSKTAEEVYSRFLDKKGLQGEERETEMEAFKSKSLYEKDRIKNELASELSKGASGADDQYAQIIAAREAEDKEYEAQQKLVEDARNQITAMPQKLVGQKIGGLEITKEMANNAVNYVLGGNFKEDGSIDVDTPIIAALVYQNYTKLVQAALESEKLRWIKERGNPSDNQLRGTGAVHDPDPLATGMQQYLNS